jgi:hypothetical protein
MGIVTRWLWRAWATLAGVLLLVGVLLCAWAVRKPWLPGLLDLRLRGEMWFVYAFLSLAASVFLMLNLWEASRGRYRWYADGLVTALILFILWAILFPVTFHPHGLQPADHAYLEGRDMREAELRSYGFAFANLRHANLTGADLRHASFWGADMTGAILIGAKLERAKFWRARATGADLTRASMKNAILHAATLQKAILRDADLRGARLDDLGTRVGAKERGGADLREADLAGADLRGAMMKGAVLTGARYDPHTRWPEGFDPQRHGAILVKKPSLLLASPLPQQGERSLVSLSLPSPLANGRRSL